MTGGAHRGPVAHSRQRRTIRVLQGVLVLAAAGLLMFAGYSLGRTSGFDDARDSASFDAPARPPIAQTAVLVLLGASALAAALALQGEGVRIPAPARLDELTSRAEAAAVDRAEAIATERSSGS